MSAFLATGLFVDGFAGGGGASTGIAQAIGRDVDIAINHSPSAIAIHKANHPGTEHHCQDIRIVWPSAATRMRPVAGAWFSPDCKEHSKAKGGPVKDRNIRQLPWEILPWLQETRPTICYIENVEEMQMWGPLDADGHVIKELRGTEFKRWIATIRRLGYRVAWRELRACDYGAPTSRKRLYIVMRCDGLPIVWPKPTHGKPGSPGVRSGRLLPYRTAAECIDWTIPCPSIFDRKRALKDATHRRIAHGVMRYVVNAAKPFIVGTAFTNTRASRVFDPQDPLRTSTTQNEYGIVDCALAPHVTKFHGTGVGAPMDGPMPTVTANGNPTRPAGATPLGMVGATIVPVTHQGSVRVHDIDDPFRTITGAHRGELALADIQLAPHIMTNRNSQKPFAGADEPTHTITAGGAHLNVVTTTIAPLISYGQHGGANRPADVPMHTIAASKKDTNAVIGATLVRTGHGEVDRNGKRRGKGHHDLGDPAPTVTSSRDEAIAAATMVQVGWGEREGQAPRALDIGKPLGTIMADGNKHAAVTAFLSSFYGSDHTNGGGDPEQPAKTVRAGGQHHAIVAAHMEQANTGMVGHDARKPLSTIVGKGCTQRIVETTLIEEGTLPPELMERAVMVAAFLCKYYATGGENETAQTQPVDRPLDTVTTRARFAVVTVTIDATTYVIVDIGLRMLKPRELARAQGFPDDYILDPVVPKMKRGKLVHEPLTIAEQISAIGNSVCPPMARALVTANQPGLTDGRMAA